MKCQTCVKADEGELCHHGCEWDIILGGPPCYIYDSSTVVSSYGGCALRHCTWL